MWNSKGGCIELTSTQGHMRLFMSSQIVIIDDVIEEFICLTVEQGNYDVLPELFGYI